MPLSDHEQRLLEQMERALYAEDPKFATTMRGADLRRRYRRRAVAAAFVFVIGIVLLMTGAVSKTTRSASRVRRHARVRVVRGHFVAASAGGRRDRDV